MEIPHLYYIILVLIGVCNGFAQVKSIGLPALENYKRTDYAAGTQNWAIGQDFKGTMYFANNNGLLQFDGTVWRTFKLPNNSAIRSLHVSESRIYVGGYNEFGYFEANNKGVLLYHSLSRQLSDLARSQIDFVWRVHQFGRRIFFQTFEKAYIYDGKRLLQLEAPNRFQFSFVVQGRMYFQDSGYGLMEYADGLLTALPGTKPITATETWGLFALPDDRLLVTTLDKGLFVYDNETLTPWNSEADAFMKKTVAWAALR